MRQNINDKPEWLDENIILLGKTGSYAYGTNTENSDQDFQGVVIPPIDYFLGIHAFNQYQNKNGSNFKNTKHDVDVSILHINKFVNELIAGSPNIIELMFLREEDYLKIDSEAELLLQNKKLFLTKHLTKRFGGFAHSLQGKLERENKKTNGKEFDTKSAMHAIRLLTTMIEILDEGSFCTYRPNREYLLDIRSGKYSYNEFTIQFEHYNQSMNQALKQTDLPDEVDLEVVNDLVIEINKSKLGF